MALAIVIADLASGGRPDPPTLRAAATLLADRSRPTAVMTSNDRCAVGLLDALLRRGMEVPGSMSVVGYDDSVLARLAHVSLTTVSQDARKQAARAVALAVQRLESAPTAPREVVLTPYLVVRSTTGPPRP